MDSGIGSEFILLAILITLNAFFSASEMAMVSVPRLRMKQLMESGNETAGLVLRLADDSSRLLATVQVGVTLMGFLASATAAINLSEGLAQLIAQLPLPGIASTAQGIAVLIITVVLAAATLILGELVPKSVALAHSERMALLVARPIDLLARFFGPIVR